MSASPAKRWAEWREAEAAEKAAFMAPFLAAGETAWRAHQEQRRAMIEKAGESLKGTE